MAETRHISARYYYDLLPPPDHQCGDVWTGLSTMGLLGNRPIPGIVVTPACDLSQKKTETITTLPIIPLRSYFSTLGLLPEIRPRVMGHMNAGRFQTKIDLGGYTFRPPAPATLDRVEAEINEHLNAKQRGATEITALNRCLAGLRILRAIAHPELIEIPSSELAAVFGAEWSRTKRRIVTNAFSSDIHFLPSDNQSLPSGLQSHSVVLFRYPLTLPVEILDLAGDSSSDQWQSVVKRYSNLIPAIRFYEMEMPIKTLTLRPEFLSDLLTRYVSVYNRIGSPDFTKASVDRITKEVDA
jgi:hypothetical protein